MPRCCARPAAPSARPIWRTRFAAHPGDRGEAGRALRAPLRPARRRGGAKAESERLAKEIERDLDAVASLDEDRILRSFLTLVEKSLRTNYFQRRPRAARSPISRSSWRAARSSCCRCRGRSARSTSEPAHGRRASARRQGGARRHPLVRPQGGFPHGDPGPDEGADGEERGHRAGGLQGRLRGEAAAGGGATRSRPKWSNATRR